MEEKSYDYLRAIQKSDKMGTGQACGAFWDRCVFSGARYGVRLGDGHFCKVKHESLQTWFVDRSMQVLQDRSGVKTKEARKITQIDPKQIEGEK